MEDHRGKGLWTKPQKPLINNVGAKPDNLAFLTGKRLLMWDGKKWVTQIKQNSTRMRSLLPKVRNSRCWQKLNRKFALERKIRLNMATETATATKLTEWEIYFSVKVTFPDTSKAGAVLNARYPASPAR
ncbi:tail fiber assembly protein [Morganella morganii]|uniref:tail fiber assembly protein n=1 Tax=Morganella morganii TaxID=582 RepID=UPI00324E709C